MADGTGEGDEMVRSKFLVALFTPRAIATISTLRSPVVFVCISTLHTCICLRSWPTGPSSLRKLEESADDARKKSERKRKRGGRGAHVARKAAVAWAMKMKTDSVAESVSAIIFGCFFIPQEGSMIFRYGMHDIVVLMSKLVLGV